MKRRTFCFGIGGVVGAILALLGVRKTTGASLPHGGPPLPRFSAGDQLSARQLNAICDRIRFLEEAIARNG